MRTYRLLSGKIGRRNAEGVMEIHRAPYDFVPTEGELAANKFRMQLVDSNGSEVAERAASTVISVPVPVFERETDIQRLSVDRAIVLVSSAESIEVLDALLARETSGLRPRKKVLAAADKRRYQLTADALFSADSGGANTNNILQETSPETAVATGE